MRRPFILSDRIRDIFETGMIIFGTGKIRADVWRHLPRDRYVRVKAGSPSQIRGLKVPRRATGQARKTSVSFNSDPECAAEPAERADGNFKLWDEHDLMTSFTGPGLSLADEIERQMQIFAPCEVCVRIYEPQLFLRIHKRT
jgi:hypothetical protein